MKRKLSVIAVVLLLFAALPLQANASVNFSDVNTHWANKEIMYLSELNIIGGYPDGTFRPNEPITRAQVSAMLVKALKIPLTDSASVEFKDVSKASPYYKILATVNEKGILRGDNGFMRPGQETSRAQMAAILRRAFDMPLDKQHTFIDVTPAHWAYQDINGIAKQRVAGGSEGKFMPGNPVTRAQFSAFLVRAMDDKMKLGKYQSYVSKKGKTVEQDGISYFVERDNDNRYQVVKKDMKNGNREVLLRDKDIVKSRWDFDSVIYLHDNTRLILYNEELYIPYWRGGFAEADEVPYAFGVMKMKTNGQGFEIMKDPEGESFRNLFIWNDRMYFTNAVFYTPRSIKPDIFEDSKLQLYSTSMDGKSDKRKELTFDARVTFDYYEETLNQPGLKREAGGENLSILFDHSTMYYFNKGGVFKYSLLDKKTSKLSNIIGKQMDVTENQLVVTDINGKKHLLKK